MSLPAELNEVTALTPKEYVAETMDSVRALWTAGDEVKAMRVLESAFYEVAGTLDAVIEAQGNKSKEKRRWLEGLAKMANRVHGWGMSDSLLWLAIFTGQKTPTPAEKRWFLDQIAEMEE